MPEAPTCDPDDGPGLRTGFTTGACAAAAARGAAFLLRGEAAPAAVTLRFPDGRERRLPLAWTEGDRTGARAGVVKDAGDDPDVTGGALVIAALAPRRDGAVVLRAGEGVGTVTKPGLAVPPGAPAVNPGPRAMIEAAVLDLLPGGATVTLSVPDGEALAARTFNPRLGVRGGISILGTTGIVQPRSREALQETIRCALDVAAAAGVRAPVLVPGAQGERAARAAFDLGEDQVVQVGNEWGAALVRLADYPADAALAAGHPGKLAKLAVGAWDTHSARSPSALEPVRAAAADLGLPTRPEATTVEALLQALPPPARRRLGQALAAAVREALGERLAWRRGPAVALTDLAGNLLATAGALDPWRPPPS